MRIWPLLTALSLCSSAAAAADPTAGWQLPMTFAKLAPAHARQWRIATGKRHQQNDLQYFGIRFPISQPPSRWSPEI